nr:LacI family DNA-binding transcriptional regulator [Kineosporia mesophila]
MRDVARAAGVSHQTVSRAINDKGEIDPETRRRILEVAQQLRYRPSRFARGLVRPGATTIGLVVDDILNPFFPELIAGVISAAEQRSWTVLISTTQNHPEREPELLGSLAGQVDALIGYLSQQDAALAAAVEGLPLVVMGRPAQESAFGAVDVDVRPGVQAAVDHLIARGHRQIGMIDCPTACEPGRRAVLLEAAAAHGVPLPAGAIVAADPNQVGGEEGLARLLTAEPGVTAVLAFNDVVAMGAYRTARRLGLSIPGDIALIGFDGLSVGEVLDPPLTTINVDKRRMGELAVAQVERLLAGEDSPLAMLSTDLLVRDSA